MGLAVEYQPPAPYTDVEVIVAPIALPGNSCRNRNALTGFIKAASCPLGSAWVGDIKGLQLGAAVSQALLQRRHCEGCPPLVGVRNVPEAACPETASLRALQGPSLRAPWVGSVASQQLSEGCSVSTQSSFHKSTDCEGPGSHARSGLHEEISPLHLQGPWVSS